ncbi:MAG: ribonuclease D [Cyclobacteriaceae bacterium]|jgi:ribonuclease D
MLSFPYPESISKEELKELPLMTFTGRIHIIDNMKDAKSAAYHLSKHEVLGFDTEKKPTFQKGAYHPTALVQLATDEEAYLFRITHNTIAQPLLELLESEEIKKVGVGIRDDIQELQMVQNFRPGAFMELIDITKSLGIINAGVRNLAGIFLQKRVSKNQQTSNWENPQLTKAQQLYASADAWIPQEIYKLLDQKGYLYP